MRLLGEVGVTPLERAEPRPGDSIVAPADVVMDRGFDLPGSPQDVFPWMVQLGKQRAGWYLPRGVERLVPARRRALRHVDPQWQALDDGDVVPDYGGPGETFTVASIDPPRTLVYRSQRGEALISWSIVLRPVQSDAGPATRVLLRLRLGPVRHRWLAYTAGEAVDLLTIAAMAAGLRERLDPHSP